MTTPAPTAAADARIPAAHPFAAHLRRVAALEAGQPHRAWTPEDGPLPSLYLSHGGGPLPFQSPEWLDPLHDWARALPKPKAILVVGSGHMTHGLPFLTREMFTDNEVPGWSADFDAWAADALARGDVAELARFRTAAPGMPYAHPTVEHFTPLFVTLGAATDPTAPVVTTLDGYGVGLSRRSFQAG